MQFNYNLTIKSNNSNKEFIKKKKKIINSVLLTLTELQKNSVIKTFNIKSNKVISKKSTNLTVNRSPHVNNKSKETFKGTLLSTTLSLNIKTTNKITCFLALNKLNYKMDTNIDYKWTEICL